MQKAAKTFIQGYNVQVAVDAETQVLVGTVVRTSSADVDAFSAVLDQVEELVGTPDRVVADAGYYSQKNVDEARGFRHFSLRGHTSVTAEFALVAVVHNLLKLFRQQVGTLKVAAKA